MLKWPLSLLILCLNFAFSSELEFEFSPDYYYFGEYSAGEHSRTNSPRFVVNHFNWMDPSPMWIVEGRPSHLPPPKIPMRPSYRTPVELKIEHIDIRLPQIFKHCLKNKCLSSEEEVIARKILAYHKTLKPMYWYDDSSIVQFAYNKNPTQLNMGHIFYIPALLELPKYGIPMSTIEYRLFETNDSLVHRDAISTVGPGYIFFNIDKIARKSYKDLAKILFHEYGHQVGEKDDQHRKLDIFADKIVASIDQFIQEEKTEHFDVTLINPIGPQVKPGESIGIEIDDIAKIPNILITNERQSINLGPDLLKLMIKKENYNFKEMKINSISVFEKENSLNLKFTLNQRLLETDLDLPINQKENSIKTYMQPDMLINGLVEINLPYQVIENRINLGGINSHQKSLNIKYNLNSKSKEFKDVNIEAIHFPKTITPGEKLSYSVTLHHDTHKKLLQNSGKITTHLNFKSNGHQLKKIFEPTLKVHHTGTEIMSPFKTKFLFHVNLPHDINSSEITLDRVVINFSTRSYVEHKISLYPKFEHKVNIQNSGHKKIEIVDYNFYVNRSKVWPEMLPMRPAMDCNEFFNYAFAYRSGYDHRNILQLKLKMKKTQTPIMFDQTYFLVDYRYNKKAPHYENNFWTYKKEYQKVYNSKQLPFSYTIEDAPRSFSNQIVRLNIDISELDEYKNYVARDLPSARNWVRISAIYLQTESLEGGFFVLNEYDTEIPASTPRYDCSRN